MGIIICPICSLNFKQENTFKKHCELNHNLKTDLRQFYIDTFFNGIEPTCECSKECKKVRKWYGWIRGFSKYFRGHNAVVDTHFNNPESIKHMTEKRKEGYASGKYAVWNKGLTRNTDERIDLMSEKISQTLNEGYDSGRLTSWQKGLTKETDERLAKASKTHIESYESGKIVCWNKGLTKYTDERLEKIGKNISVSMLNSELTNRHTKEEIVEIIESTKSFTACDNVSDNIHFNSYSKFNVLCKKCGKESKKTIAHLKNVDICYYCHPNESKGQLAILEFIRSIIPNEDVISCDRTILGGKELDIYIPKFKFAIEFNGLYWHCSKVLKDFDCCHENKTKRSLDAGVRLFHVYSDEWRDKQDILESMIRRVLEKAEVIESDDLVIEINKDIALDFFDKNHLEGSCFLDKAYALKKDDEIIAVISISITDEFIDITRFAMKNNLIITDALKKLVDYVSSLFKIDVLINVDSRFEDVEAYYDIGFEFINFSDIKNWITDGVVRYDDDFTQEQIDKKGFYKISGCKSSILIKTF